MNLTREEREYAKELIGRGIPAKNIIEAIQARRERQAMEEMLYGTSSSSAGVGTNPYGQGQGRDALLGQIDSMENVINRRGGMMEAPLSDLQRYDSLLGARRKSLGY